MLKTHIGTVSLLTFDQQFSLLFLHVRVVVIQKQLIIFVHGERALVDQQDDQTNSEESEYSTQRFQLAS